MNDFKLIELIELFVEFEDNANKLELSLHLKAQEFLANNDLGSSMENITFV